MPKLDFRNPLKHQARDIRSHHLLVDSNGNPLAVDGPATTGTLRTLGFGSLQAMAGTALPNAHASRHEQGGVDVVTPALHASRHEQGGADAVVPALHASRHNDGGADVLTGLARFYPTALTPASVAANTTTEQTFTVTGLVVGDTVVVNKPTHQVGLGIVGARVSAANTVAITFGNFSAGAIVPTAETYRVTALR